MGKKSVYLVTGASSGIGAAVAQALATDAAVLLLTGRNAARLDTVAGLCRAAGATVETSTVAVTDRTNFAAQILAWDSQYPVDTVIANAGISGGAGSPWHDIIDTNIAGCFAAVEPLIARMTARKSGHIALVSSMAGFRGMPNAPAYSVSKVAVRAYGDALRPLLKPHGIKVSVIYPGFVKTPLTDTNRFHMPFLMTADRAGGIIARGLKRKKKTIAFPFRMYVIARFVAWLPDCIGDFILSRAPKK